MTDEERAAIEGILPGNEIEILRMLHEHADRQLLGQQNESGASAWRLVGQNLHGSWTALVAQSKGNPR